MLLKTIDVEHCQPVKNHQIIIWDQTKLLRSLYIIMLKSCFSHIIIWISTTFLFVKLMKTPPGSIIKATNGRSIKYFIFNSEIVKCLSISIEVIKGHEINLLALSLSEFHYSLYLLAVDVSIRKKYGTSCHKILVITLFFFRKIYRLIGNP